MRQKLAGLSTKPPRFMAGSGLIEVLITLVVLSFALLGLARLQVNVQITEMESYQRTQALILVRDMANRVSTNRRNAASYVTTSALGTGMTCPTSTTALVDSDKKEWCEAIQGAAEKTGTSSVGTVIGGRGCIEQLAIGNEYMITLAWQGLAALAAPASTVTCGAGLYHTANGSTCDNTELCRRTVTTIVRFDAL